jgi:addiction module HigA family antidote
MEAVMSHERKGPAGFAIHPGEILKFEFLKPLKLSGYALANSIDVDPQSVSDLVLRKKRVTAEMALRLAKFFGTTEQFWMNLQSAYDLRIAKKSMNGSLRKIKPLAAA